MRLGRYRQGLLDSLVDNDTGAAEARRLEAKLESFFERAENDSNALLATEYVTDIGVL